jgi:hypothetical protein
MECGSMAAAYYLLGKQIAHFIRGYLSLSFSLRLHINLHKVIYVLNLPQPGMDQKLQW